MGNEIFDEVEHWLAFIKSWDQDSDEQVPEDVIRALEIALDKAVTHYRNRDKHIIIDQYFH